MVYMGFAGSTWSKCNDVLALADVLTAGQFHRQNLVQRWDRFEVEAVQTLCGRELRSLDAPLDHPTLTLDQLQLAEPQQILHMVLVLGCALLGQLGVFALEGWQPELC